MEDRLDGQVAIVTGGGRGIGRTIAQHLAAAGANIVVAARSRSEVDETAALIERAGGVASALAVDIAEWASVQQLVADTQAHFGAIDLLVQNAGVMGPIAPVWEIDPEDWRSVVEVNLIGTFHCARAVLPQMIERRRGRIINLMGGRVGVSSCPYFTAYQASKAGVVWLGEDLARETAEFGVSVFTINPGAVATDMSRGVAHSGWAQRFFGADEETVARAFATPPERAAELCVLLACGAADRLSGRVFSATSDEAATVRDADAILKRDARVLRFRP